MVDKALKNPKIEVLWNSAIEDIMGDKVVESVKIRNLEKNEVYEKKLQGVFIAIGHKPNTDLFKGQLEMNDVGYLKTKPGTSYTSVEGVFAAGDVADHVYRQAITAAGTGCMAAIDSERWLEKQGH
jgi:thioredoxin reductase (NADPH)